VSERACVCMRTRLSVHAVHLCMLFMWACPRVLLHVCMRVSQCVQYVCASARLVHVAVRVRACSCMCARLLLRAVRLCKCAPVS
jgi:hypothetical protein